MNDIVIFSKTAEEHLKHADIVLPLLVYVGAIFKWKMCFEFSRATGYIETLVALAPQQVPQKAKNAIRTLQ